MGVMPSGWWELEENQEGLSRKGTPPSCVYPLPPHTEGQGQSACLRKSCEGKAPPPSLPGQLQFIATGMTHFAPPPPPPPPDVTSRGGIES